MEDWLKHINTTTLYYIGIGVYLLFVFYIIFKIIKDTTNASKALGYLLLIIVLPVIGMILYLSIGVNYRLEKLYKRKYSRDRKFYENLKHQIISITEERIKENTELLSGKIQSIRMLLKDSSSALYSTEKIKLLINGENKFKEVIKELNNATKHIHIQYYIFSDDKIGNIIKDILIKKAQEGVVVRFIFDDFGSHELSKNVIDELNENGVETAAFYKIHLYALANRLNYRNHRKMIIIDGAIGFIGGINIDDKYINTEDPNKLFWRDTHLMIKGEAINGMQYIFLNDWNFCSENKVDTYNEDYFFHQNYITYQQSNEFVQIAASGPDSDRATIMLLYDGIIMSSQKRLYLTTPYLIPNETIINAIKYAALSGVDVRLLVPLESDSRIVNAASCSYYEELLASGVRIYRYKKGFVHAKTIVSDDNLAVIGSANLDIRSFELNFEVSAIVYSKITNQKLADVFMKDLEDSVEINYKEWKRKNKLIKFGNSIAKLISPLL